MSRSLYSCIEFAANIVKSVIGCNKIMLLSGTELGLFLHVTLQRHRGWLREVLDGQRLLFWCHLVVDGGDAGVRENKREAVLLIYHQFNYLLVDSTEYVSVSTLIARAGNARSNTLRNSHTRHTKIHKPH